MSLIDEIKHAQKIAGEQAVIRDLEGKGLVVNIHGTPTHYTACFKVHDPQAFDKLRQALCDLMLPQSPAPYEVTAISSDHEMQRLDLIQQALEKVDDVFALRDIIDAIIHTDGVGNIKNFEDMEL